MGVEAALAGLKPKTRKLFDNVIIILIIFMILYAFLSFLPYINAPMRFFSDPAFVNTVVIFVFLGIAYKLLHGGKIYIPDQSQQKTKINMPNVWGVNSLDTQKTNSQPRPRPRQTSAKKIKRRLSSSRSSTVSGSWNCPKCGSLNVTRKTCKKCGYRH